VTSQSSEHVLATTSPAGAHAAILAGHVVQIVVGPDPEDPTCLHYLDRCYADHHREMIYSEAIGGWSDATMSQVLQEDE
jgi:hypothetical protein